MVVLRKPTWFLILVLLALLAHTSRALPMSSIYHTHLPIFINGNKGFNSTNGVVSGTGTLEDPYLIEGWQINASATTGVRVNGTTAHFTILDTLIHGGGENNYGILLTNVENGSVEKSSIMSNEAGIVLETSSSITVYGNRVVSNVLAGIDLFSSINVTVSANLVSESAKGILLFNSDDILFYRNNFVNNTEQAHVNGGSKIAWNTTYPVGGNYWSAYTGSDDYKGPLQNISGSDGIIDQPKVIDSSDTDYYPLLKPYDTGLPYWPTGTRLVSSSVSETSVVLSWTAAADDTWVAGYGVYNGTTLLAIVSGSTHAHNVTGLKSNTTYIFRMEAVDAAGNWSADGPSTSVRTLPLKPEIIDRAQYAPFTMTEIALAFGIVAVILASGLYLLSRRKIEMQTLDPPIRFADRSHKTRGRKILEG